MIRFLFSSVIAISLLSADVASVAGKWKIDTSAAGRENTLECTLTQTESRIGGTCATKGGVVPVSGKIDGAKVKFSYKSDSEGGPVTVEYTGTVEGGKSMKGSILAVEFSVEGEFKGALLP